MMNLPLLHKQAIQAMPPLMELHTQYPGKYWMPTADSYTYYRYLVGMVRALEPTQVVELGGANGLGAHYMLSNMPDDSNLYTVDIVNALSELRAQPPQRNNAHILIGDTRDMTIWDECGVDLSKTDLWFFDSDHTYEQLTAEWTLYSRHFREGTVVMLDDVLLNEGMWQAWQEIPQAKLLAPEIHFSGWGLVAA